MTCETGLLSAEKKEGKQMLTLAITSVSRD